MKSVLISIQPKWCELIASGKKTVEVRKTKPKLETPFKVYIYETKGKLRWCNKCQDTDCERPYPNCACFEGQGKVIGEFVCDAIFPMSIWYSNPNDRLSRREYPYTCLTDKEIMDYLGNGVEGYGWHISNLVIYDKPKDLSEFKPYNRTEDDCKYSHLGYAIPKCSDCHECYVKKPPQSWCYVEELKGE